MPEKANILLVDDREDNLISLEAALTALDQNLVRASSGEAALKALLEREFAVILLDVMMPGMDGFETAAHIKQRERTKDIPIIFLTGAEIARHQVFRGYSTRSIDYLTKPFDPSVLQAKVEVFIELYQTRQRLREQSRLLHDLLGESPGAADSQALLGELEARVTTIRTALSAARQELPTAGPVASTLVHDLEQPVSDLAALVRTLRGDDGPSSMESGTS
ncbi:response regulator [Lipingzhangella sp. LS1_29]|uniref:Response regulator n=1 Tax=Lipingzhangella rawalii TaxID=2055835 RepID=A0ABU2H3M9_9ACTN|nr:response regulator [Lipingzhangella rawalii]MDS1269906.1 response regulator [Lipingzhangella rawalii]